MTLTGLGRAENPGIAVFWLVILVDGPPKAQSWREDCFAAESAFESDSSVGSFSLMHTVMRSRPYLEQGME